MSTFQVRLKNNDQGVMDVATEVVSWQPDPLVPPVLYNASLQRQVYVMGPKKINRLMRDGDIFEDCNYWKKFAPYHPDNNPMGVPPEKAIIYILDDDGSVYSDIPGDNVFAWSTTETVNAVDTAVADFGAEFGSYAVSAIIRNDGAENATVTINGTASFPLNAGAVQVLNTGDVVIRTIEAETAGLDTEINVFAGVRNVCRS